MGLARLSFSPRVAGPRGWGGVGGGDERPGTQAPARNPRRERAGPDRFIPKSRLRGNLVRIQNWVWPQSQTRGKKRLGGGWRVKSQLPSPLPGSPGLGQGGRSVRCVHTGASVRSKKGSTATAATTTTTKLSAPTTHQPPARADQGLQGRTGWMQPSSGPSPGPPPLLTLSAQQGILAATSDSVALGC